MSKKLLIVGGVAGGASCAARTRRLDEDADIIIFEQGEYVSFANCGLPYHVGNVIPDKENLIVVTPEMLWEWFRIEVRVKSQVLSIDAKNQSITVKNLETNAIYDEMYNALVLSPGAKPKFPQIDGLDLPNIFSLRNIPDALSMKEWINKLKVRDVVIVGGGFIGLELAENFLNLGIKVHIVEMNNYVLPSVDEEIAIFVKNHMLKMGVKVYLETGIYKFEDSEKKGIEAHLISGEVIYTDMAVIATGVSPENFLAVEAGIEIGNNGGIKVDKQMRTSIPNIWAVGDVTEINDFITDDPVQIPLAGPANRQGRIAAGSVVNNSSSTKFFRGVQKTSVCGVLGMTIASTGLNENHLKKLNGKKKFEYEKIHVHAYDHAEYYPGAKKITLKLIFSRDGGLILGAQALGMAGVEKRIDVIAMAIQNKASVFDLAEAELCYAPQYGSAKDVVNIAGMVASNLLEGYFDVVHWDKLGSKDVVILDVREDFVYDREHIGGAINIPLGELRENFSILNKEKEIWVYCSEGKRSYFACRILVQKGFKAKSFSGGYTMYQACKKTSTV